MNPGENSCTGFPLLTYLADVVSNGKVVDYQSVLEDSSHLIYDICRRTLWQLGNTHM